MYEINKEEWHTCKICGQKIQNLAKVYGGGNIYFREVFKIHLERDHEISVNDYFENICKLKFPKCKCGICNQKSRVVQDSSKFKFREFLCGRFPGQQEWSKKAKEARKGAGNPMFGKSAWNRGLNKENNEVMARMAEKQKDRITSEETKKKQSESAKKRLIHGHTGCPHSKQTRELLKRKTIASIKRGVFKQLKTKPFLAFGKLLDDLNIKYEIEYNLSYWSFDYYLTEYNILVEIDGDYFHSNPKTYPNGPKTKTQKINYSRDLKKNKFCEENNLYLLRFWECDIINDIEGIKCKLKELLGLNILENNKLLT